MTHLKIIPLAFLALLPFITSTTVNLDPKFQVTYHANEARDQITFELIVETTGWVGLGFSSNGAMTKADIFVGGVRGGQPYFGDYHGPDSGNGAPIQDVKNDFTLISASENATHTTISFKRLTDTCDAEDVAITVIHQIINF